MMSHISHFALMADYNQWMNQRCYALALSLDQAALEQETGAFFGSILGTLNHILVGDLIWLRRFAEHPVRLKSLERVQYMPMPSALNSVLYTDPKLLQQTRSAVDEVILAFADELDAEILASSLEYHNINGDSFTKNFGQLILHLFNHQTHHRGQLSTLFNQIGVDIGVTDLLLRIPDE